MDKNGVQFRLNNILGETSSTEKCFDQEFITFMTTTDNTATLMYALPIEVGTMISFQIIVDAIQTGGAAGTVGDAAHWLYIDGAAKNVGGTSSMMNNLTSQSPYATDLASNNWVVDVQANDTLDQVEITVTGDTDKIVNWLCKIKVQTLK